MKKLFILFSGLCLIALFPSCNGDPNIINVNNDDKLRLFYTSIFDSGGVISPKDTILFKFSKDIELHDETIIDIYGLNVTYSDSEDFPINEFTIINNVKSEVSKVNPKNLLVFKEDGFLANVNKYNEKYGGYQGYIFEIKVSLLDKRSSNFAWNFLVMKPDSTD